ncbi:GNAT family N-acetyltransferase, partial [Pseudomonas aeruginosa]
MRSMPDQVTDVRLLDDGYSREVRSLFYHAYRHKPTFAYRMDAQRACYDQRVRSCVREMGERHLGEELPAIGLCIDDRLVSSAWITP